MKRHAGFVPLSREHHDGLLLATRLQQGRAALLRLWSHDPVWQAEYVVRFFDEHLLPHFTTEEEIVFPVARAVAGLEEVVRELLDEHREMRLLVTRLRSGDPDPAATLLRFGTILEHHIRTEERVLFQRCEERLEEAELERLGRAIAPRHKGTA